MMKKSAKLMSALLALTIGVSMVGLTACGPTTTTPPEDKKDPPTPPAHTHTFATTWESDDTDHWHPATCEHKTEKSGKAAHDANGADGACSVCGHAHTHTFESDWTYDANKHWHIASCIHFDLIDGEAAHTIGADGACSVCGYAAHVHTYATEWSKSDYAHWYAATCTEDGHSARYAKSSAPHTFDANNKCTVCGYEHKHSVVKYKGVNADGHWTAWECVHEAQAMEEKPDFEAHDTTGPNGACSVCGWLPIVEAPVKDASGAVINNHTHKGEWQYSAYYHWKRLKCGLKDLGCKSCDKGYYEGTAKNYDWGEHVFNAEGKCECGFNKWSWGYGTDECIECEVCGGCIKTVCKNSEKADHKSCGHARGANAKTVKLAGKDAELWRVDGETPSISDYTGGKRDGIQVGNEVNASWTLTVNKATTVTLRILGTRREKTFAEGANVQVNGKKFTTKTPLAQPSGEDSKCNPAWLTFGCITLEAGENRLEILQVGAGFNLTEIELITDADVTIEYTKVENSWLTSIAQNIPIPRADGKPHI